jgi:Na+/H+ antiporter NhaA
LLAAAAVVPDIQAVAVVAVFFTQLTTVLLQAALTNFQ